MAQTAADTSRRARRKSKIEVQRPPGGARRGLALAFLAPALVLLGAFVIYPSIDTVFQSVQEDQGSYLWERSFTGVGNYADMADNSEIRTAIKNNAIWVATAPAIITGLGLMFAILTERVRYATAIKVIVFMPMAISFLATGVIWRVMYDPDPNLGFVNAAVNSVADIADPPGSFPDAVVPPDAALRKADDGAVVTTQDYSEGDTALIGLTAIAEGDIPEEAEQAVEPDVPSDGLGAVVWRDFKPGGGEVGVVEEGEFGLPGLAVEVMNASGDVIQTGVTEADGSVTFAELDGGPFSAQLTASNFDKGFTGVDWLKESLVTPAIIGAFSWMWVGFSVVVIGAGLAALPRDVLEAARVDGATEWQTFRHVTLPLLAPVLGVVFVTMVINVLKIFDIVLVTAPGNVQDDANVIALEMFKTAFTGRQFSLGSAIAVLLFILVIPVMFLNIRRFRREK
ncbi:MAG: sugar ABC transporter permease [Actinomycetota bacterium]|nr:sugar ABC transporter permease [Actinomycetota bacterium]